ncbi:hypothetical protein FACS189472_18720 [Alphaproteobacteria bacterium]|nr:hypothetical protein FACS189472_18720 [Alphaproteobacteria bacterium]
MWCGGVKLLVGGSAGAAEKNAPARMLPRVDDSDFEQMVEMRMNPPFTFGPTQTEKEDALLYLVCESTLVHKGLASSGLPAMCMLYVAEGTIVPEVVKCIRKLQPYQQAFSYFAQVLGWMGQSVVDAGSDMSVA